MAGFAGQFKKSSPPQRVLSMEQLQLLYSRAVTSTCFERAWKNRDFVDLWKVKHNFELTRQSGCSEKLRESLLLKLTVIQKLFERIPVVNCWYLVKICSDDASLCNLMRGLIACLGSTCQHLAFSAAKTIVVAVRILSKQLITLDCLQMLFDFSDSGAGHEQPWKHLYTLIALRQIIRSCRELPQQLTEHAQCPDHQTESEDLRLSSMKLADWFLSSFNLVHVFFHCVPFIVRPNCIYSFVESCGSNNTTKDFALLQACQKLGHLIHEQENTMCAISKRQVHTFNAFLLLLSEMATYLQDSAAKYDLLPNSKTQLNFSENDSNATKHSMADSCVTGQLSTMSSTAAIMEKEPEPDCSVRGSTIPCNRSTKEREIGNTVVLLVQYLHFQRLQPLIYKNISEVLNQVLTLPISTFKSSNKPGCVKLNRIQRHSAIAVMSIADCCLLRNTPRCFGFVGFGGTEVRCSPGVSSDGLQDSVDCVALRKATLLLLKSYFILLETVMEQEGSPVIQSLCFQCFSHWNKGLLSLGPELLSAHKVHSPEYGGNELCLIYTALFSDQDDELIDALLLLLLLLQRISRICIRDEIRADVLHQLSPHWLFALFAESIDFDHSVLLDFLISSETRFLEYILHYLHFLLNDWEQFVERVATYRGDQLLIATESARKGYAMDRGIHVEGARYSFKGGDKFEFCESELSSSGESEVLEPHVTGEEDLSTSPSVILKRNPSHPVNSEGLPSSITPDCSENSDLAGNTTSANTSSRHIVPGVFESGKMRTLKGKLTEASGLATIASAYCSSDDSSVDDDDEIAKTGGITTALLGEESASMKDENLVSSSCIKDFFSLAEENQEVEGETFAARLRGSEYGRISDMFWTKGVNRCGNLSAETNRFALLQKFTESSVSSRAEVCLHNNKRLSHETGLPISKDAISAEADTKGDMSTRIDHVPCSNGEPPPYMATNTEPHDAHGVPGVTRCKESGCYRSCRILDRIMSMFIRLRIALERLSGENYFPYSAVPLLKLLESVEMCYDGC